MAGTHDRRSATYCRIAASRTFSRLRRPAKPSNVPGRGDLPRGSKRAVPASLKIHFVAELIWLQCLGEHPFVSLLAKYSGFFRSCVCSRLLQLVIVGTVACLALSSCAVGPDYHAPEPPLPQRFVASASNSNLVAAPDRPAEANQWWRTLHDRELDSLVDRAIAANPTLEIALERLQQARAQEAVVIGVALPIAEASAGGGWGSGSDLARGRASQTLVSAENAMGSQVVNLIGFDAVWEIDVFGKYRRAIEAAQYDVDAAVAARNIVLVSVIADVTRAYLDLRALQMQLAVLRKSIEVAQQVC